MYLSSTEEYGLRCALQLARANALSLEKVLPAREIAEKEGISLQYVSKFMHLFSRQGLVKATRGAQGGFYLSKDPARISLRDILHAARSGSEKSDRVDQEKFCSQYAGLKPQCVNYQECSIRPVWQVLSVYFDGLLEELTLSDLLCSESETRDRVVSLVSGKIKKAPGHDRCPALLEETNARNP